MADLILETTFLIDLERELRLAHDMAVVTGNESHFRRVPELTVLSHLRPAA